MAWEIIIYGDRKPLSEVKLTDMPEDLACVIAKGDRASYRVVRVPSLRRLVVWDQNDKKRTSSFMLKEDSSFEEMVMTAIDLWESTSDRYSLAN